MLRFFLLALLFFGVIASADPKFPELTGRVVDEAGLLSPAEEHSLANMSGTIERDSTVQVVVVTLKSLDGYDIADYGYQLGRYWKVGQRDQDNGILIMIAPHEHKVRIEIGYGLEGFITDAQAFEMIQKQMLPRFKEKDVYGGIKNTVDAIGTILSKEYTTEYGADKSSHMNLFYIIAIALIPLVLIILGLFNQLIKEHFGARSLPWIEAFYSGGFAGLVTWIMIPNFIYTGIAVLIFAAIGYFEGRRISSSDFLSSVLDMGNSVPSSGGSFEVFSGGGGDFGGAGASADIGSLLDGLESL